MIQGLSQKLNRIYTEIIHDIFVSKIGPLHGCMVKCERLNVKLAVIQPDLIKGVRNGFMDDTNSLIKYVIS